LDGDRIKGPNQIFSYSFHLNLLSKNVNVIKNTAETLVQANKETGSKVYVDRSKHTNTSYVVVMKA